VEQRHLCQYRYIGCVEKQTLFLEKTETVYLGSRCDPYMPLEEEYGLTRKCLLVLDQLRINTMLTTKADCDLIFRDLELLKNFKAEMTILMGMSNINQVGKRTQNN